MSDTKEKAPAARAADRPPVPGRVLFDPLRPTERPQEYYDAIKQKFAEARDLRLSYRPDGTAQYTSDLTGELARYEIDPYGGDTRAARADQRHGGSAVHRRRLLRAAHRGAAARARRREHPHRRARRRRRRHLVLEPLSGRGLRRAAPTTTCRCSTRWTTCPAASTPRGRKSSRTARRSPANTTSTISPCSRPR